MWIIYARALHPHVTYIIFKYTKITDKKKKKKKKEKKEKKWFIHTGQSNGFATFFVRLCIISVTYTFIVTLHQQTQNCVSFVYKICVFDLLVIHMNRDSLLHIFFSSTQYREIFVLIRLIFVSFQVRALQHAFRNMILELKYGYETRGEHTRQIIIQFWYAFDINILLCSTLKQNKTHLTCAHKTVKHLLWAIVWLVLLFVFPWIIGPI